MKKLIAILLLFSSCGYAPMDNASTHVIITEIEFVPYANACNYYGEGRISMTITPTSNLFKFRDTCGKFQIGDTVNLVKK